MNLLKWTLMSKHKKLLYQIKCAKSNKQRLHLRNGVVLDFTEKHKQDGKQMKVYLIKLDYDNGMEYDENYQFVETIAIATTREKAEEYVNSYVPDKDDGEEWSETHCEGFESDFIKIFTREYENCDYPESERIYIKEMETI